MDTAGYVIGMCILSVNVMGIYWLFISPSKSKYMICPNFFYFRARCCYTPFISERKRTKNTVAKVHFKQVGKVNFFVVIHLIGSLTTNVRRRGGVVKNSSKSNVSTYLDRFPTEY